MPIKSFEVGEFCHYMEQVENHRMVDEVRQVCDLPAEVVEAWVKCVPEAFATLPHIKTVPGEYREREIDGFINKGFIVVKNEDWRAFGIFNRDTVPYLYEIRFKEIFTQQ